MQMREEKTKSEKQVTSQHENIKSGNNLIKEWFCGIELYWNVLERRSIA